MKDARDRLRERLMERKRLLRERRRQLKLERLMAAADAAGRPVFAATEGKRA